MEFSEEGEDLPEKIYCEFNSGGIKYFAEIYNDKVKRRIKVGKGKMCMKKEELRKFFIEVDSLLSLLVHRHGDYLEQIGEKDIAIKLYRQARQYYEKKEGEN